MSADEPASRPRDRKWNHVEEFARKSFRSSARENRETAMLPSEFHPTMRRRIGDGFLMYQNNRNGQSPSG